jgi:hypothetical protein
MDRMGKIPGGNRDRLVALIHGDWIIVGSATRGGISIFETVTLSFLESRDIQSGHLIDQDAPLRNLFELLSFVARVFVAVFALWAISFARQQADEARASREEAERASGLVARV